MMNKRQFLKTMPMLGLSVNSFAKSLNMDFKDQQPENVVADENFWMKVRNQFVVDENYIDLRAISASSIPNVSFDKFTKDYRFAQTFPSQRNSEINEMAMHVLRKKIAKQINCSEKEIAVMRSTTETLCIGFVSDCHLRQHSDSSLPNGSK
jgi:selenocysteine lyase/cysteine desulfurase